MKKKLTAAELMARLNADPDFVAKRAREEAERQEKEGEWARAEAPLVHALRAAGYEVGSAWDLVNSAGPYPAALPILMEHLTRPYPGAVREGIARALAVPEARSGWELLVRQYRDELHPRAKDGLAVALAATADDSVLGELIALLREARHGASRILLLGALARSQDARARTALMELGADPELYAEVQAILRKGGGRAR